MKEVLKGQHEGSLWWRNYSVSWLSCCVHSWVQIKQEVWISSVDCINVNILVMVLYFIFARCFHWRKLDKLFIISWNCVGIYNYINKISVKKYQWHQVLFFSLKIFYCEILQWIFFFTFLQNLSLPKKIYVIFGS